jgi:hypothetical protein
MLRTPRSNLRDAGGRWHPRTQPQLANRTRIGWNGMNKGLPDKEHWSGVSDCPAPVHHRAVQISELIDAVALNLSDKVRLKPGIAKLGWGSGGSNPRTVVLGYSQPSLRDWFAICVDG